MKKALLLACATLALTTFVNAQSWQWGRRGGGANDYSGGNGTNESIDDMATDRNGNVYVVSKLISGPPATIHNTTVTTYETTFGSYHPTNIVLASFSCNGTLRWTKVIGGSNGAHGAAVRTDSFGHVYLCGWVGTVQSGTGAVQMHFSTDTTLPFNLNKSMFVAQYDTAGNYKWLRMPQPDTISDIQRVNRSGIYDMEVDYNGNVNLLTFMLPGNVSGSSMSIPTEGTYVLKYSPSGALLNVTSPPITVKGYATQASNTITYFRSVRITPTRSGKWIFAGTQELDNGMSYVPIKLGGQSINSYGFIACFNNQWQLLWKRTDDSMLNAAIYGRAVLDGAENIYVVGAGANKGTVFGDTIRAPLASPNGVAFVAKADINGRKIWLNNASDDHTTTAPIVSGGCVSTSVALRADGSVFTVGHGAGMKWGSYQVAGLANAGYMVFLTRHDSATGAIIKLDTLKHIDNNYSTAMASSPRGDIFIGGESDNTITIGSDVVSKIGGSSDFFVGKYGFSCGCSIPTPAFNITSTTGKTVQYTYTGTTTSIDSLVWNWGDGQKQKVGSGFSTPISHTFAANGKYNVTVTAYGTCGIGNYAKQTPLAVSSLSSLGNVQVYPNPASDRLTIEGAQGATAILYNSIGQQAAQLHVNTDKQVMDIASLPSGSYILQLTDAQGNRGAMSILRQ